MTYTIEWWRNSRPLYNFLDTTQDPYCMHEVHMGQENYDRLLELKGQAALDFIQEWADKLDKDTHHEPPSSPSSWRR